MLPLAIFAAVPSWLWKTLGALGILVAVYFYGDVKATHREQAKCEAAARAAQVAADKQDTTAQQQVQQDDGRVAAALETQKEEFDARIKSLQGQLEISHPSCIYPMPKPSPVRVQHSKGSAK
jgi:hypothetical protein